MKLTVTKKEYRSVKKLYLAMKREMVKEFKDCDFIEDLNDDIKIESIKEKAFELTVNPKSANEFYTLDINDEFVEDFINVIEIPFMKKLIRLISTVISLSEKLYTDFKLRFSKFEEKWLIDETDEMVE